MITWSQIEAFAKSEIEAAISRLEQFSTTTEDTMYQRGRLSALRQLLRLPQDATDANLGDRE